MCRALIGIFEERCTEQLRCSLGQKKKREREPPLCISAGCVILCETPRPGDAALCPGSSAVRTKAAASADTVASMLMSTVPLPWLSRIVAASLDTQPSSTRSPEEAH
jgi:hypothetical protein